MIENKYSIDVSKETIVEDLRRLINQIWKLIPMRENNENWKFHLETVIVELVGLQEIFNELDFIIILSDLEGLLRKEETTFMAYRKTVFSVISLLGKVL